MADKTSGRGERSGGIGVAERIPSAPPIRRDHELPAVTGELAQDLEMPYVPEFPSSPIPGRRRRGRRSRPEPITTRTTGGTIVTFPPQNAPGTTSPGEPGDIGRITASIPVTAPDPRPPAPSAELHLPIPELEVEEPVLDLSRLDEQAFQPPEIDGAALSVVAPPDHEEFTPPKPLLFGTEDPGPVVDPEPTLDPDSDPVSAEQADPDPGPGRDAGIDAGESADTKHLFATRTSEVSAGPPPPDPYAWPDDLHGQAPAVPAAEAVPKPLVEADSWQPDEAAPDYDNTEYDNNDESLDELLAELSAVTDHQPTVVSRDPGADQAPPIDLRMLPPPEAVPPSLMDVLDPPIDDIRFAPPPQFHSQSQPHTASPRDPRAVVEADRQLFDTPSRRGAGRPGLEVGQKSPAELFATETSLLPAKTRRGDVRVAPSPDSGSWFTRTGELPTIQVGSQEGQRRPRRFRRFLRRLVSSLLICLVLAAVLFVALNSIYI